jgi:hypothetical protein
MARVAAMLDGTRQRQRALLPAWLRGLAALSDTRRYDGSETFNPKVAGSIPARPTSAHLSPLVCGAVGEVLEPAARTGLDRAQWCPSRAAIERHPEYGDLVCAGAAAPTRRDGGDPQIRSLCGSQRVK